MTDLPTDRTPEPANPDLSPADRIRRIVVKEIDRLERAQDEGQPLSPLDLQRLAELRRELAEVDKAEEEEREELDLTGISDETLDEMLALYERANWSSERRAAYGADMTAKREERERVYQRGLRCRCPQPCDPTSPPPTPAPVRTYR
jgi:hypothetical protein